MSNPTTMLPNHPATLVALYAAAALIWLRVTYLLFHAIT